VLALGMASCLAWVPLETACWAVGCAWDAEARARGARGARDTAARLGVPERASDGAWALALDEAWDTAWDTASLFQVAMADLNRGRWYRNQTHGVDAWTWRQRKVTVGGQTALLRGRTMQQHTNLSPLIHSNRQRFMGSC